MFVLSTLLFFSSEAICTGIESTEVVDRVVAIVNDDIISLNDLNEYLKPYVNDIQSKGYTLDQQRKMLYGAQEEILNKLIDQKLTDQEVKKYKLNVDEKEIDHAVQKIMEYNSTSTVEEFANSLRRQGITMDELRQNVKNQILRAQLVNRTIRSKIVVTDEDIKEYYENNPESFEGKKKYHLKSIHSPVSPLTSNTAKSGSEKKMESILAKLESGESFDAISRNLSDSSSIQITDLGLMDFEDLSSQLKEALKDIPMGGHTSVIKNDMGNQIYYIQSIETEAGKSLEASAAEIREKLYQEYIDEKFYSWLKDLRKHSHIKIIE
jgi:peptidyl-prolyl cis-trans isomerase SurA